jgi:F420H(2)-dependent quinone reductase
MKLRPAAIRAMGRSHRAVYRLTGGRLLGRVAGMPVLLLTTTGRRSGRARTTPLTYFEVGEDLVVVASNGGEDSPPAWWLNLCALPEATITVATDTHPVTARAATDEEHERLWPMITTTHPGYAGYARRTHRPIPVVVLSRSTKNAPSR